MSEALCVRGNIKASQCTCPPEQGKVSSYFMAELQNVQLAEQNSLRHKSINKKNGIMFSCYRMSLSWVLKLVIPLKLSVHLQSHAELEGCNTQTAICPYSEEVVIDAQLLIFIVIHWKIVTRINSWVTERSFFFSDLPESQIHYSVRGLPQWTGRPHTITKESGGLQSEMSLKCVWVLVSSYRFVRLAFEASEPGVLTVFLSQSPTGQASTSISVPCCCSHAHVSVFTVFSSTSGQPFSSCC